MLVIISRNLVYIDLMVVSAGISVIMAIISADYEKKSDLFEDNRDTSGYAESDLALRMTHPSKVETNFFGARTPYT